MKNIFKVLLVVMFASAVSACNTVEGAGKDVKAGGAAVEREAAEHK